MSLFRFILHVLSILMVIHIAMAIKCWDCRSDEDVKCADPFDNSTLPIRDCATVPAPSHLPGIKSTLCRKTRQKVNGEWRYYRSCAFLGEPGIANDERFCIMRSGTYNIFVEYCTCNTKDGCNSAPSIRQESRWFKWSLALFSTVAIYLTTK